MYVFKIMIRIPWDLLINIMKLIMHYQDIVRALDQLIFFSVPWAVSRRISDSRIGNWCFITILRRLGLLSSSEVVAIFILGGWSSYYRCWATLQGCNICRIDLLSFILVSVLYIFQVGWYLAHLLWISLYLWIFCTRYVVQNPRAAICRRLVSTTAALGVLTHGSELSVYWRDCSRLFESVLNTTKSPWCMNG